MFFNKEYVKNCLKYPFSSESRKFIRNYKNTNFKLIMTLLVKDEEEIIEQNIRIHKALGVDGFIVTSHNSIDKTNEILEKLKKEGLVLEIIYETSKVFAQDKFCNKMIKLAKNKYRADWIISADADEIYCPVPLAVKTSSYYQQNMTNNDQLPIYNLKDCIAEYEKYGINVLLINPMTFFPDGRKNYMSCPYFLSRSINFDSCLKDEKTDISSFVNFLYQDFKKVIFKSSGFKKIAVGNHSVKMKNKKIVPCANIKFFHYHIKNYEGFIKRAQRWQNFANTLPKGNGTQELFYVDLYKNGKLKEFYDSLFNENICSKLQQEGIIVIDKSISYLIEKIKLLYQ